VWDAATGFGLATLKGHTDRVLAWRSAGRRASGLGRRQGPTVRVWDGRPQTAETEAEREALGALDFLFARPLRQADVIDYLRNAPSIGPQARSMALALAERYREESDPQQFYAAAWPVIRHPHSNDFLCQFALAQMNAACERAPDNEQYRLALGVAQYRLGKFQKERYPDALATLAPCDQQQPLTLAFLALTQKQLGQQEQARTTLARLRDVMKDPQRARNADAEAGLREAAALIEGQPEPPGP
jgi:hypothetical protein